MTINLKNVLARAETWSEQDQEELAQVALEIEARRHGLYHASPDELKAIDEALAAVRAARSPATRRSRRFSPSIAGHEGPLVEVGPGGIG